MEGVIDCSCKCVVSVHAKTTNMRTRGIARQKSPDISCVVQCYMSPNGEGQGRLDSELFWVPAPLKAVEPHEPHPQTSTMGLILYSIAGQRTSQLASQDNQPVG